MPITLCVPTTSTLHHTYARAVSAPAHLEDEVLRGVGVGFEPVAQEVVVEPQSQSILLLLGAEYEQM